MFGIDKIVVGGRMSIAPGPAKFVGAAGKSQTRVCAFSLTRTHLRPHGQVPKLSLSNYASVQLLRPPPLETAERKAGVASAIFGPKTAGGIVRQVEKSLICSLLPVGLSSRVSEQVAFSLRG